MPRRVLVTGGTGFLGQHVVAAFQAAGWEAVALGRKDGDLRDPTTIRTLLGCYWPEAVVHLAAACGGIGANQKQPADYFYDNALMGLHVIHESSKLPQVRLIVAGTICAYPHTPPTIPFVEGELWDGFPEPTNAPYGIAKKSLAVMLDAYRRQHGLDGCYLMPTNLYGPGDNFHPETSHVIPAIIRQVLAAQDSGAAHVTLWGSGQPTRDFLYVQDAARAFVLAAEKKGVAGPFNLGSGHEVCVRDVAVAIARQCGWEGSFLWDSVKPDGQPRRVLDSGQARSALDWKATTSLADGLANTIAWWREQLGVA